MSNPTHSFLPWARRGLASQILENEIFDGINTPPSPVDDERAKIKAYVHHKVKINNAVVPAGSPLQVDLQIIGPGDVIGIHKDVVVKTEPHDWITNFEPHSFAFIDFYEEDFPWRYTPAKAVSNNKKLRPWLTLVVLKENEFTRKTIEGAPLNAIKLAATAGTHRPLPKNDELWAWAHVSVDKELTGTTLDDKITNLNTEVNKNPNIAISRIICPRKLEENTSYNAFLIPTYETGRLAGLNMDTAGVKAQAPAWDHSNATVWPGTNEADTFPVYYEWYFRTGATGDFEYLVRQIQPRALDPRVGRRLMDIQAPGYGLSYNGGIGTTAGTEMLEGALRAPLGATTPFPTTAAEISFSNKLKDFVNLGEDMLTIPASNNNPMYRTGPNTYTTHPATNGTPLTSDPIVAPPLYGRWHALRSFVDPNPFNNPNLWLNELNLDPRYRVAAALGGDYVRKYQEFLMNESWKQIGKVMEANRQAMLAQLAMSTSKAIHTKHIASQPVDQLLPMTSNVHAKIKTGTVTLKQDTLDSSLPESASSSTFRKLSRPTGVLMKRLSTVATQTINSDAMTEMILGNLAPVEAKLAPGAVASTFQMTSLDTALAAIQSVPNAAAIPFNISLPAGPLASPNSAVAVNFQDAFAPFTNVFATNNWVAPANDPNLAASTNVISDSIDPGFTQVKSFYKALKFVTPPVLVPDVIVPAMAAPSFALSMYETLRDLGIEYFIPNLNLLPQNSITLFESNQKFIEAYLAGANYEMGRELLWREYPTDQRGTYFRHFWNSVDSGKAEGNTLDIKLMHQWESDKTLGSHSGRGSIVANNLVLGIRGDLLKKFPNVVIYMKKAKWETTVGGNRVEDDNIAVLPEDPIFSAKVNPDITFLGFNIDRNTALGLDSNGAVKNPLDPGYFFVLMERPGELRFGVDVDPSTAIPILNWNKLNWNHVSKNPAYYVDLKNSPINTVTNVTNKKFPVTSTDPNVPNVEWAEDGSAMAMIFYQNPVKALIHAKEMIP